MQAFGVLVFVEGGKSENPEKKHRRKARTNNKLDPHMASGWNRTRASQVGGERSQNYANPAPLKRFFFSRCTHLVSTNGKCERGVLR